MRQPCDTSVWLISLPFSLSLLQMYTPAEVDLLRDLPTNNYQHTQRMPQPALNASFHTNSLPMHAYHPMANSLSPSQLRRHQGPMSGPTVQSQQPHPMSMATMATAATSPSRPGGTGSFFNAAAAAAAAASLTGVNARSPPPPSARGVGAGGNGIPERSASALAGGGVGVGGEFTEQKRSRSESYSGLSTSSPPPG